MKCVICKADFIALRRDARYCSTNCRSRNYRKRLLSAARGMAEEEKVEAQRQAEADRQRKHAARLAAASGGGLPRRSRVPLEEQVMMQAPAGACSYRLILGLNSAGYPHYVPDLSRGWGLLPFQPPDDHRLEEGRTYRLIWLDAQSREISPRETDQAPGLYYFLGQPERPTSVESLEVRELTRTCAALRSQVMQLEQKSQELEQQAVELSARLSAKKRSKRRAQKRLRKAQKKIQAWEQRLQWLVPLAIVAVPKMQSYLRGDIDGETLLKPFSGVIDAIFEQIKVLMETYIRAQVGKGRTPAESKSSPKERSSASALRESKGWHELMKIEQDIEKLVLLFAQVNQPGTTAPLDKESFLSPSLLGLGQVAGLVHQQIRQILSVIQRVGQVTALDLAYLRRVAEDLKEALRQILPDPQASLAKELHARMSFLKEAFEQAILTAESELSLRGNSSSAQSKYRAAAENPDRPMSAPASSASTASSSDKARSQPRAAHRATGKSPPVLVMGSPISIHPTFFTTPKNPTPPQPAAAHPVASQTAVHPTEREDLSWRDEEMARQVLMPWATGSGFDLAAAPSASTAFPAE